MENEIKHSLMFVCPKCGKDLEWELWQGCMTTIYKAECCEEEFFLKDGQLVIRVGRIK